MTQRSNFSRRALLGSLAAAGTLGAASCTGASSGGGAASGGEDGGIPEPSVSCEIPEANIDDSELDLGEVSGEITFMTQGLKGTFDDFFTDLIADFESANPGTSITWTDQGGTTDFDTLMVTQAGNCSMADVINVPSSTVLALSRANLLLDYDVKAPGSGDPFVPAIWDSTGFGAQGHHTALPWYFGPLLVTYNKDVFERAGLDPDTPPATMDEYFEMCHRIAAADNGDYALYGNTSWYLIDQWHGMGVEAMNEDSSEFTFASDENALRWMTEMASLYSEGAIPKDSVLGDLDQSQAYTEGNLAFGTPNASFLRNVRSANQDVYDATGVGRGMRDEGLNPIFSGQYISVSVTSPNAPLAVAWAKHLTDPAQGLGWAQYGMDTETAVVFPATTEALEDPSLGETSGEDVMSQARAISAEEAKISEAYLPSFFLTGQVQEALINSVNKAIVGEIEPQAALDEAQQAMNRLLERSEG
ncbi:MAG TPA: extracellular solute-binding protein [Actinomycetaceae bacterium]|nr:extracellular solute-binding protein [Actinomycetaceae bacterium]